ncbi:MAG: ABC transporter substrate-binding protein, partial [Spirochaetota bacterium]
MSLKSKIISMDLVMAGADEHSNTVINPVLDTLYDYDYFADGYPLVPLLAEGMPEVSADNLLYTFTIKKGVYYYDPRHEVFPDQQREVKAEDFIYSILRLSDWTQKGKGYWLIAGFVEGLDEWRQNSSPNNSPNNLGGNSDGKYETLPSGLKILDDYRFQVKLVNPYPQILYFFTMNYSAPMPREVFAKYKSSGLKNRIIGTGAYYLDPEQTVDDQKYVYLKNPTYRERYIDSEFAPTELQGKRLPLNGGINLRVIGAGSPSWLAFLQGDLDLYNLDKKFFNRALVGGELAPELQAQKARLLVSSARASIVSNFINYE